MPNGNNKFFEKLVIKDFKNSMYGDQYGYRVSVKVNGKETEFDIIHEQSRTAFEIKHHLTSEDVTKHVNKCGQFWHPFFICANPEPITKELSREFMKSRVMVYREALEHSTNTLDYRFTGTFDLKHHVYRGVTTNGNWHTAQSLDRLDFLKHRFAGWYRRYISLMPQGNPYGMQNGTSSPFGRVLPIFDIDHNKEEILIPKLQRVMNLFSYSKILIRSTDKGYHVILENRLSPASYIAHAKILGADTFTDKNGNFDTKRIIRVPTSTSGYIYVEV